MRLQAVRLWSCEAERFSGCETDRLWVCIVRLRCVKLWGWEVVRLWDYETMRLWYDTIEAMRLWYWGYEALNLEGGGLRFLLFHLLPSPPLRTQITLDNLAWSAIGRDLTSHREKGVEVKGKMFMSRERTSVK